MVRIIALDADTNEVVVSRLVTGGRTASTVRRIRNDRTQRLVIISHHEDIPDILKVW